MSIPSIPDNLYKLLVLIGTVLIIYCFFIKIEPLKSQYEMDKKNVQSVVDSLLAISSKYDEAMDDILRLDEIEIKKIEKLDAKLPKDNVLSEQRYSNYINQRKQLLMRLDNNMALLKENGTKAELSFKRAKLLIQKLEQDYTELQDKIEIFLFVGAIGVILFLIGIVGLISHQKIQDEILNRQLGEKEKFYPHCQSCGKNFSSFVFYGTRVDGTPLKSFCIGCFENGVFTEPNLTFSQLKERAFRSFIRNKNPFMRWDLLRRLKSLDRWNENPYE